MGERRKIRKINIQRRKINKSRIINQDIIKVSIFFCVLAAALIVYLCIFLTFDASSVINNTFNKRTESFKKIVKRGNIYSADGEVLAYSEVEDGVEYRYYPFNNVFSHVVGFEDYGGLGLESSYNFYMLTTHTNMFEKISNEFNGVKNPGDSINTTLNSNMQQYIYDLLGGLRGGVIALDPKTGHIYSMVSKPDFDPNSIAYNWDEISNDNENSPLVNRVTQGKYAPGSTFKLFTLNEFMNENSNYEDYRFFCEGTTQVEEGVDISCSDYTEHGDESLKDAFAYSCNCAFSNIGLTLNLDKFKEANEKLLFNQDLPIDIAFNKPSYVLEKDDSKFMIMETAFGQGKTLTNPLHLSLVMSAIANDGVLMTPHLVTSTVNDAGNIIERFKDSKYEKLFTDEEVIRLRDYLRAVCEYGTGTRLNRGNYTAYGKTGTAQTSDSKENQKDNSWFVGFAENDGQSLVVCAIIEDTNETDVSATYIASKVFNYYFN